MIQYDTIWYNMIQYDTIRYESKVRLNRRGKCKHRMLPYASYSFEAFSCDAAKYTGLQGYQRLLCNNLAILCTVEQNVWNWTQGIFQNWNMSYRILSQAYCTASQTESRFKTNKQCAISLATSPYPLNISLGTKQIYPWQTINKKHYYTFIYFFYFY